MSVHDKLVELVGPYIKDYRNDLLVHDKDEIDQYPGVPFLHWTRKCGTTIATMLPTSLLPAAGEIVPILFGRGDRGVIVQNVVELAEYYNRQTVTVPLLTLYCDGEDIRVITTSAALLIARDYQQALQIEWATAMAVA